MAGKRERDHKTQLKAFKVFRSYCQQKGCKYFGDHAVQGHCFSKLDKKTDAYISMVMNEGEAMLKGMESLRKANKQTTDKAWIKALEGMLVCTWANNHFTLDEVIHHRAKIAALNHKHKKPLAARASEKGE